MKSNQSVQTIYQERPTVIRGGKRQAAPVRKTRGCCYDYTLLFAVIFLFSVGLLIIFSGSQYTAMLQTGDATYYFKKQLMIGGAGLLGAIIASRLDYRILKMWILPVLAYLAAVLFPALTLLLGVATNGKTRWISVAGVSFQPAELAKIGLIISLAAFIESAQEWIDNRRIFLIAMAMILLPSLLVFSQNLSSGFIILFIGAVMLFAASKNWKLFTAVGGFGIACFLAAKPLVCLAVNNSGYTGVPSQYWLRRILAWAMPAAYPNDAYQTTQGLYAIGSGGLTGRGLGESIQKFGKIPEVQNDMIFTVICEEFGFIGALAVVICFAVILWRIFAVAKNARDMFGVMICTGVMAHLGIQAVLNLAVVTGVFPNTGVTLPFISYGGSAILFTMFEIGLVLSVSNRIPRES